MNRVKTLVVNKYVRAVEGGGGGAKTGVNYAASLYAAEEAKHAGFTQVLWLDGRERKYIDEVGTMNIMRSEEHTSELQSQSNLVCRLLLEKKKNRWMHTQCIDTSAIT